MTQKISEKGPWVAYMDASNQAYIRSRDFTHDVMLRIHGDFEDALQLYEYARQLVWRMNNMPEFSEDSAP